MEIDGCVEAINSDQALSEVDSPPRCVTFHPGFNPICLETGHFAKQDESIERLTGLRTISQI